MMSIPPSEFFDQIKHHHQNIDDNFEQPSMIISKLRAYQRQAVKWMIDRENNNDCKLINVKYIFQIVMCFLDNNSYVLNVYLIH